MDKEEEPESGTPGENGSTKLNTTIIDFEQPATLVGQRLDGRFLIEKDLADSGADEGGFGLVYLARDTKLMDNEVVVKILKQTALKHDDIVRKFLHEKEALIRLNHPGIVRILDHGTLTDGNPFMVMEYIEGHSLRKKLEKKGRLSFEDAANLIEAVTDAIAAAHSKNILHRDIKPENIMLTPQDGGFDRVRLIDFGIARVGDSQLAPATEISRAIGTVLYMPPEQLIGRLDLKPSTDIYATAIVAYEILTGQVPFNPKAIAEMYVLEQAGVKTLPSQLQPDLPVAAERILLSALEFEPEKRPQKIREFGRDMAAALRSTSRVTEGGQGDLSEMKTVAETKVAPTDFATVRRPAAPVASPDMPKPNRLLKWAAVGVFAMILLSLPVGYLIWNFLKPATDQPASNAAPVATVTEHFLTYYLNVQKMRDKKPLGTPYKSSGSEPLLSGDKFSIAFQPEAGYMYIFNEGKDEKGNIGYYLLFPTSSSNNGSSQVAAAQIETAQNNLGGTKGTEIMWMIWTKQKNDDLEAVTRSAVLTSGGVKFISSADSLRNFLEKYKAQKSESVTDADKTIVKAKGEVIIHRFEIEHQ